MLPFNNLARQCMGSVFGTIAGVVKHRTEQVSNNVSVSCYVNLKLFRKMGRTDVAECSNMMFC